MEEASTYHVMTNGQLMDGHEVEAVQQAFAELFKVPLEKAQKVVGRKTVLKKGLDLKSAKAYQKRLESIGLGIQLKEQKPVPKPSMTLTLEPIEKEANRDNTNETDSAPMTSSQAESLSFTGQSTSPSNTTITCPKCNLEQPKSEQCQGCGVFFNKLQSTAVPNVSSPSEQQDQGTAPFQSAILGTTPELDIKSIGAACGAAFAGALLWKIIAVSFNYEFGMIAWLIGGMVGFAAVLTGAHGEKAAGMCAVLALLAILGGKYMAFETYKDNFNQVIEEELDEESLQEMYEEELVAARQYQELDTDEQSKRQFMVDFGYSESYEPEDVTSEEIAFFDEYEAPTLSDLALYEPPFEEWKNVYLVGMVNNISTIDLIKEDFGFLDALFIFFGVSTAFQLVYRQGSK